MFSNVLILQNLVEWLSLLESRHFKAIDLGLERVAAVKQRLDIQFKCPVIVVGGTNGKGSTCAMLESILQRAGYRVGLYINRISCISTSARAYAANVHPMKH